MNWRQTIWSICILVFSLESKPSLAQETFSLPELNNSIRLPSQVFKTTVSNYRLTSIQTDYFDSGSWQLEKAYMYRYSGTRNHNNIDFVHLMDYGENPDFDTLEVYSGGNDNWMLAEAYYKTYDEQGNPVQYEQISNYPAYTAKQLYTYAWNAENTLKESAYYWWSDNELVYISASKTSYSYSQSNLSKMEAYSWRESDADWQLNRETTYSYNDGGLIEMAISSNFIPINPDVTREIYSYNKNGQLEEVLYQKLQGEATSAEWHNLDRTIYTYNEDDLLAEILLQGFFLDSWKIRERILYSYSGTGLLSSEIRERYTAGQILNAFQYSISYNEHSLPAMVVVSTLDDNDWRDICRHRYSYENYEDAYLLDDAYAVYNIDIQPNPASQYADLFVVNDTSEEAELLLHDVNGQLIYKKRIALFNGPTTIRLYLGAMSISNGEYFISILASSKTYTGKLLVI